MKLSERPFIMIQFCNGQLYDDLSWYPIVGMTCAIPYTPWNQIRTCGDKFQMLQKWKDFFKAGDFETFCGVVRDILIHKGNLSKPVIILETKLNVYLSQFFLLLVGEVYDEYGSPPSCFLVNPREDMLHPTTYGRADKTRLKPPYKIDFMEKKPKKFAHKYIIIENVKEQLATGTEMLGMFEILVSYVFRNRTV